MKIKFRLSHEALLFDSPLYILKAFVGVFIAYAVFSRNAFVGKDMISVLFAMMLTLEPISVVGLHSGLAQVKGTLLGGIIGFLVVSIGGVNIWTVPLAVAITLYIALVMDWRVVPAVAIFTSIYMTQYIQYDGLGNADMLMTLALRMSALGSGILVAVIVNSVFSRLGYRRMISKRLVYSMEMTKAYFSDVVIFNQTDFSKALIPILSQLNSVDQEIQRATIFGHKNLKNKYQYLVGIMISLIYDIRTFSEQDKDQCDLEGLLGFVTGVMDYAVLLLKDFPLKEDKPYVIPHEKSHDREEEYSYIINKLQDLIESIEAIKALERS